MKTTRIFLLLTAAALLAQSPPARADEVLAEAARDANAIIKGEKENAKNPPPAVPAAVTCGRVKFQGILEPDEKTTPYDRLAGFFEKGTAPEPAELVGWRAGLAFSNDRSTKPFAAVLVGEGRKSPSAELLAGKDSLKLAVVTSEHPERVRKVIVNSMELGAVKQIRSVAEEVFKATKLEFGAGEIIATDSSDPDGPCVNRIRKYGAGIILQATCTGENDRDSYRNTYYYFVRDVTPSPLVLNLNL